MGKLHVYSSCDTASDNDLYDKVVQQHEEMNGLIKQHFIKTRDEYNI